jgi:hypothetical protein
MFRIMQDSHLQACSKNLDTQFKHTIVHGMSRNTLQEILVKTLFNKQSTLICQTTLYRMYTKEWCNFKS